MAIEMPRGLPFSVDTFGPYTAAKTRNRHHFLSHAHKDHTVGIFPSNIVFPIYSTSLTISLLLQRLPQLDQSFFLRIEIGQSLIVDDPDGEFKVTAFDANHCPGSFLLPIFDCFSSAAYMIPKKKQWKRNLVEAFLLLLLQMILAKILVGIRENYTDQ